MLFGCYRTGDANDPEIYTAAVVAVLSDYSPETVQVVCDPRTGLPSRLKWLPSVAEVKEACEAHKALLDKQEEARRWKARREASRVYMVPHNPNQRIENANG